MAAAENGASQASTSSPLESRALSYIQDAEKCAEAVLGMFNLVKFNSEQCMYLCDKLHVVIESASSSLTAVGGHEVGTDFVRTFELLMVLGKQIESFVEGCCKDNWIQAAAVSFNMSRCVSSLGFHLDMCNVAFLDEDEASMDDVDSMNRSAAELVKQKASVDAESLRLKVVEALNSLSGEDRDLADYLLERLSGMRRISSSGSGNLFARLKPEKQVGKGASASVYEAMWLGTRVAMKTFEGSENEGFEKEVEILSRLCHPNITSVFCSTKDTRSCSIVMELMDGDLYQLISERMQSSDSAPFPILEAVDIMLQISEGVKYLHDQGIVHRDLKSRNILYKAMQVEDGGSRCAHVKVADFGISKARDTNTTFSELTRNTGTTRWMPPEVIGLSGKNQRHKPKYPFKLDSYSFGLVCYEVLVGRLPFSEYKNPKELKESILNKERPQLPCEPRECPPMLKDLIEKCWSHEPKQRPTFGDICRGLKYIKYLLMTERWMKHGGMIAERKREGGTAQRGGKTAGWGAKTAVMGLLTRFSAPNWRGLKLNLNKSTSRSRPLIFDPKITSGMLEFLFEGDSLVGCTLLGEGGKGKVYKVPLQDDLVVAIKRVRIETTEDDYYSNQIRAELETLRFIRHRNVVQLLAYIFKPDSHLLIYEYVPGGSLQDALHRMALGTLSLSWPERHRILCGVAQGLVYLHNESLGSSIVHRGIKPANILLDEDAKLCDFGLAAIVPLEATHNSTDVLVGTIGFIAPEYYQTMRYSQKSDVFSFGVVIAQLLTARDPTDQFVVENGGSIGQWLHKCLQGSNAVADAIDSALWGSGYEAEILLAMKVAVFCTNQDPQQRPRSTEVLKMLLRIRNPEPRTPRGDNLSLDSQGSDTPILTSSGPLRVPKVDPNKPILRSLNLMVAEVVRATEGFKEKLADDGVFYGVLGDTRIAVRKLQGAHGAAVAAGLEGLAQLRHWSLVQMLGFCCAPELTAIVTELMPTGSLHDLMYNNKGDAHLNWTQRFNAAIGVAEGLRYLHHECAAPTVHGDLKPSTIMFNPFMEARITAFGVAKLVAENGVASQRDPSYTSPELTYTMKGDVYSFGVILLEMISGRSPRLLPRGVSMPEWIRATLTDSKSLPNILDPMLATELDAQQQKISMVLGVALLCARENPKERPYFTNVLNMLNHIKTQPTHGSQRSRSRGIT